MLAAELAIALHVGGDAAVGEQRVELAEAQGEAFELLAEGWFHGAGGARATATRRARAGERLDAAIAANACRCPAAAAAAQEEARHGLREAAPLVAFDGVQLGERAVQDLLRQAARQRLEHGVDVLAAGEQLLGARDLERAPVVGLRVQRLDQRHRAAPVEPLDEALHAGLDDRLGLRHRRLALLAAHLHQRREIVDGVEVDVGQARDLGLDVAWHGEVDHEHRPVPARLQRPLDGAQADDRQRAGGARDDDVELGQPRRQVGEREGRRREARAELVGARRAAVRDREQARLAGREVGRGQLDHLAGADEEHLGLAHVLEKLRRQAHRGRRHADRMAADLGRRAHLLGDRERALEHLLQRAAERAGAARLAHRLLQLAEDLRLAENHRVEAAGDAKGVARRRRPFEHVGVRAQRRGLDAAHVGEPLERRLDGAASARRRRARYGCRSRRSRPPRPVARRDRNAFKVVASCCGASANRPRRSSGAVVWLSPRAKTLIGRL